jgi:hypothetical protein
LLETNVLLQKVAGSSGNCAQISLPSTLKLQICGCNSPGCPTCPCQNSATLNKGFEGVSGVMDDVDEGTDEDDTEEDSDQDDVADDVDSSDSESDSSDSANSDDKYVATAPMTNSEEKQGFEAVSGSGEVPVYTEEATNPKNQDQNDVFKGDHLNFTLE